MGEIRKKGEEISKGEDRKFQGKEEKGEKGGKNVVIHWSGPVVQLSCILGGSQSCWEIIDGQVCLLYRHKVNKTKQHQHHGQIVVSSKSSVQLGNI